MQWRVLVAAVLVTGCLGGEAMASPIGQPLEGGAGTAPAAPQAPANLLLPPHLAGTFPHMLVLGQERSLPTLQDAVRVIPAQMVPGSPQGVRRDR